MSGPWSEPIDLGIRGAIDPGHVVGEDGTRYLFVSGVRRIQLADDGLSTVGELEKVYDGWRYPDDWITEAYALGGPEALPAQDGWFYLVSAVGGTGGPADRAHGHRRALAVGARAVGEPPAQPDRPHRGCGRGVVVARARDARAGSRGPGADDEWWMISHGYENGYRTLGRQILLEPIRWSEDGWPEAVVRDLGGPIAGACRCRAQTPAAGRRRRLLAARARRALDLPRARSPARPSALRVDDGLVLRGKGTSPADTSPLAMLTGDHSYEIEVDVTRRAAASRPACCCSSTTGSSAAWASTASGC